MKPCTPTASLLLPSSALQFTLRTPSVSPTATPACDYPSDDVQHLSARWVYGRRVGTSARVASFAPRVQTQWELLFGIQGW